MQIPFPISLRMAIWASNWLSNLIHQSHLDIYNAVVTFSLVFSLCGDVFFFSDKGWEKGKKMCGPRAVASKLFMFESEESPKDASKAWHVLLHADCGSKFRCQASNCWGFQWMRLKFWSETTKKENKKWRKPGLETCAMWKNMVFHWSNLFGSKIVEASLMELWWQGAGRGAAAATCCSGGGAVVRGKREAIGGSWNILGCSPAR